MMKQKRTQVLIQAVLIVVIILAILGASSAAVSSAASSAPTATPSVPDPRPQPPHIETWGIPDPPGGEPAGCAGQSNCGVMCYYISENAAANQFELSCIPWIFE